jgi:hypothetical protein
MTASSSQPPPQHQPTTPIDFPYDGFGAVAGTQTKVPVHKAGEVYTSAASESARYVRYDICFDLVNQLEAYCLRKLAQHPDWTLDEFQRKLRAGVCRRYDWNCSTEELRWILKQLCARRGWEETPEFLAPLEFVSLCPEYEVTDPRIIDRLLGHKYTEAGDLIPPEPAPETVVDQVKKMLASRPTKKGKEE